MNRNDYKEQYELSKTNVNPLIDRIFNDFESRICKNCKHGVPKQTLGIGIEKYDCLIDVRQYGSLHLNNEAGFGCNKWVSKDDSN